MEITLLLISMSIFVFYMRYVIVNYGIQQSISDTYYRLPDALKFIFPLVLWGFTLPIMLVSKTTLILLSIGFINLVGATAMYRRDRLTNIIHMIGTIGGMALGLLSMLFDFQSYNALLIFIIVSMILSVVSKNYMWWIEIIFFVTLWSVIFSNII